MSRAPFPNKAVMGIPHLSMVRARTIAVDAARHARSFAPKATLQSSSHFTPIWGEGWFGVAWENDYVWFNEAGTRPFTMNKLSGKLVPMWVNDKDGKERAKNPKIKTRRLADGRQQVLIFRRAAKKNQRKNEWRMVDGQMVRKSVPRSYPGAPGRIAVNRSQGLFRQKDTVTNPANPGHISPGNTGVRWRNPGIQSGRFLARGLYVAAIEAGLPAAPVNYLNRWNAGPYSSFAVIVQEG